MSALVGHLMRRGHEVLSAQGEEKIEIPRTVTLVFTATGLLFLVLIFSIEYTFGYLISTLALIESPSEDISFEPIPTIDADDGMPKDPETTTSKPTFITSSFRRTIKLLRSKDGLSSCYRGLSMFLVYNVAVNTASNIVALLPLMRILPISIPKIIATIICAQLSLGWTIIVISEPSPKAWYHRIPPVHLWKKIVGPTAIYAIANETAVGLSLFLAFHGFGVPQNPKEFLRLPERQQQVVMAKWLGVFILGILLSLIIVVPSNIILTRIQASLIQETEETIVPFDRSFGGRVAPEIVTGSGRVGIVDAWNTFDWPARFRLVKIYAKVVAMILAVYLLLAIVVAVEGTVLGKAYRPIVVTDVAN